jgi:hypothetical protein
MDALSYENNVRLMQQLAWKAANRAHAQGLALEQDDLFQEIAIVWHKCRSGFDPAAGIRFSTYFVNATHNRLSKMMELARRQRDLEVHIDFGENSETDPFETFENHGAEHPDLDLLFEERFAELARTHSPAAQLTLRWFIQPPESIRAELAALESKEGAARSDHELARVVRVAAALFGMEESDERKLRRELSLMIEALTEEFDD